VIHDALFGGALTIRPRSLRGRILWLYGLSFMLVGGINYLGTELPTITQRYLALPLDYAPAWVYGLVFVAVGGFAMASSYLPGDRDRWGYMAAATFAGVWASGFVCGWLFYDAPIRALGSATVWVISSALLVTCARTPLIYIDSEG
jgi:hypothetical protein